jgi:LysR family transcriptional activator of nhaA
MLLPTTNTALRRSLDHAFDDRQIRPRVLAEFEDSALLKAFGAHMEAAFPAPSVIAAEVCQQYGVKLVGRLDGVRERFYAISVEKRLKHPAVVAISQGARDDLFPPRRQRRSL